MSTMKIITRLFGVAFHGLKQMFLLNPLQGRVEACGNYEDLKHQKLDLMAYLKREDVKGECIGDIPHDINYRKSEDSKAVR